MSAGVVRARIHIYLVAALRTLRRHSIALLAGLLGSLAAALVMGLLRLWWGTPTPPELVGERLLPLMSADQFVALLIRFQPHSKTGPLGLALLGQCIIGVLLGPAYVLTVQAWEKKKLSSREAAAERWFPQSAAWTLAVAFATSMELIALALFWPVLPEGLFGDPIGISRLLTIAALALTFATYAAVVAVAYQIFRHIWGAWADIGPDVARDTGMAREPSVDTPREQMVISRREALQTAGVTVSLIVVGAWAGDRLIDAYLSRSNLSYEGHGTSGPLTSPITPNTDFYVVSKNVLDPTVEVGRWRLELTGLVRQPRTWTYAEVQQLPAETRAVTLECISNEVGGNLLSTAWWRGVTLQTLLDLGGGTGSVADRHVVFYAVDGYTTSLPLEALLEARTLLAWQMNGSALPDRHGFPLRAVVPGRYGEQSAKWVTRVDITDHEFKGFYQSQGWSAATLETYSRIDQPRGQAGMGAIPVSGVAFAGTRGISRVEVSTDDGTTWSIAILVPPLSDQTWVLWHWLWHPAGPGFYTLRARATDGTGALQTPIERGTVPDGATGWPMVRVLVK
jgi:DMSO/TMAO reductase YedYZ molybdopterin-dependent catalytic subunit